MNAAKSREAKSARRCRTQPKAVPKLLNDTPISAPSTASHLVARAATARSAVLPPGEIESDDPTVLCSRVRQLCRPTQPTSVDSNPPSFTLLHEFLQRLLEIPNPFVIAACFCPKLVDNLTQARPFCWFCVLHERLPWRSTQRALACSRKEGFSMCFAPTANA